MSLDSALQQMKTIREFTLQSFEDLSEEQILAVPEPFKNNILWNAAHVLVSQYKLTFGLAGQPLPVPDSYVTLFSRGTSPADWPATPDIEDVKARLAAASDIIAEAATNGSLVSFRPVMLPSKVTAKSIDDVLTFHCFHEGFHLGIISALRKVV